MELFKLGLTGRELVYGLALYEKTRGVEKMDNKEELVPTMDREEKINSCFLDIFNKVSEIQESIAQLSKMGVEVEEYNDQYILVENGDGVVSVSKETAKHINNREDFEREARIEDRLAQEVGDAYG